MVYFKFLNATGLSPYQKFRWPLPTRNADGIWTPGAWTEPVEGLELCASGYHLSTEDGIFSWSNEQMYLAEPTPDSPFLHGKPERKIVTSSARLLRPIVGWDQRDPQRVAQLTLALFDLHLPHLRDGRLRARKMRAVLQGMAATGDLDPSHLPRIPAYYRHDTTLSYHAAMVLQSCESAIRGARYYSFHRIAKDLVHNLVGARHYLRRRTVTEPEMLAALVRFLLAAGLDSGSTEGVRSCN